MNVEEYTKQINLKMQAFRQLRGEIVELTNEFIKDNEHHSMTVVDYATGLEFYRSIDEFAFFTAWIHDMLNDNRKVNKKINKALGYS